MSSSKKRISPVINNSKEFKASESDNIEEWSVKPDFIYGGPFIKLDNPDPFINTATPINLLLQGTFKKSFAYYTLKERIPVILTKIIDYLSRDTDKIRANGATDDDIKGYIHFISKLKNDLVTNKKYELLKVETEEAKRWNEWIKNCDNQRYFTNTWLFTECYIYRRLREGCEIHKSLQNFDPFAVQKLNAYNASVEYMCLVADKLVDMLPQSEKDKRKADFVTLLKVCLWSNKCDLSLTLGDPTTIQTKSPSQTDPKTETSVTSSARDKSDVSQESEKPNCISIDPFQMVINLKDKLLVDDTGKIADQVVNKADNMRKAIEGAPVVEGSGTVKSATAVAPAAPPAAQDAPQIPCPAKMTIPQAVMFDIVCDNSGYELFTDLCLANFLISQGIVDKVRFHLKKIPWFISDVTIKDFVQVITSCANAGFNKELPPAPVPAPKEGEEPPPPEPPKFLTSNNLQILGQQWLKFYQDGTFIVMDDDFWTSPHPFKDMKKYDYNLYRKLQYACTVLFKGDLNYRKLLGERNWNPSTGFETALQGFIPAPVAALRTVKSELICAMPKGKWDVLTKLDDKWMQRGDYGVIHFCAKAEALKVSDRPCLDYGDTCFGQTCPVHTDM